MFYIGIDPGINGGCAILNDSLELEAKRCPKDVKLMAEVLFKYQFEECYAVIERVHAFPGQGVVSCFTFGNNFGQWEGILSAYDIPYIYVQPKKWMEYFQPLSKDKKRRKKELKQKAQELHPNERVTLLTADAILIAHYCKGWDTLNE